MTIDSIRFLRVASVNGVALHQPGETLSPEILRQRACSELLRQADARPRR
jgi:peptidyl-prolyl cis-trans isomerase C